MGRSLNNERSSSIIASTLGCLMKFCIVGNPMAETTGHSITQQHVDDRRSVEICVMCAICVLGFISVPLALDEN